MKFKEALEIYWKSNPYFQLTVMFLLVFVGALIWVGNTPGVIIGLISATWITLLAGAYFNIKKIQKRNDNNNKREEG